jgi:hypothetical protein
MRSFEIPDAKDVITGELAIHGEWLVASVHTNGSWAVHSQKVAYRGRDIWTLPVAIDVFPGAAIKRPPDLEWIDCQRLLARFLSAVAWVEEIGILIEEFTGGGLPRQMGRRSNLGLIICDEFDFSYLPEPGDDKTLLALALMREGRGLNHPGYSFLSFYRVIEVSRQGEATAD